MTATLRPGSWASFFFPLGEHPKGGGRRSKPRRLCRNFVIATVSAVVSEFCSQRLGRKCFQKYRVGLLVSNLKCGRCFQRCQMNRCGWETISATALWLMSQTFVSDLLMCILDYLLWSLLHQNLSYNLKTSNINNRISHFYSNIKSTEIWVHIKMLLHILAKYFFSTWNLCKHKEGEK